MAEAAEIIEKSLTLDAKREKRLIEGDQVISSLAKTGFFQKEPNESQDYSDYYAPQKSILIFNSKLVSFEYEHQEKYFGCCVNPGNAVILSPGGDTKAIESFAQKNKCKYSTSSEIYFVPEVVSKRISNRERQGLVEVSCKDNYLNE